MDEAAFWRSTLRQIDARLCVLTDQDRKADLRAGVLAATLANQWRAKGSPAAKPSDFFPSLRSADEPSEAPRQSMSPEEQKAFLVAKWGDRIVRAERTEP